jgi:peroxiredoxin
MKPTHVLPAALASLVVLACAAPAPADVAVGQAAPAFTLQDLDGATHSLSDFADKVVVLEWINPNCPVSDRHAREKTMTELADRHGEVVWLAINSTNADHGDYLAPAEHKAWAAEHGIDYAILVDQTSETGRAYGARTTPHMFIVDEAGTVAYNGAIDDDPPGRKAKDERTNYVDGGLVAHAAGQAVDPATTKPYGCSVKY